MKTVGPMPPVAATLLLSAFSCSEDRDIVLESMCEEFEDRCQKQGCLRAVRWYWEQALRSTGRGLVHFCYWGVSMIAHYYKISIRYMRKRWIFSLVNLGSLALGLACAMAILSYALYEMSFDRFHEKAERICRLENRFEYGGAILPGPAMPLLVESLPEIENGVRLYYPYTWGRKALIATETTGHFVEDFFIADPSVFDVFSFQFIAGGAASALQDKYSVVITESMAALFFGEEDPMGRQLTYADTLTLTVNGVIAALPAESHFQADVICSMALYSKLRPDEINQWGNSAFFTYLLYSEGVKHAEVEAKISAIMMQHQPDDNQFQYYTRPLTEIHLQSRLRKELKPNSQMKHLLLLGGIAIMILLIGGMNYINQTTAIGVGRCKEIGLRKVIGARRKQLLAQFITESLMTCMAGVVLAVILLVLGRGMLERLTGIPFQFELLLNGRFLLGVLGLVSGLMLLAGSVPSLLFSSYSPLLALSGQPRIRQVKSTLLRKVFIVVQFSVSIALIIFSTVMSRQMRFMQHSDLGFNAEQVVVFHTMRNQRAVEKTALITQAFSSVPGVEQVGRSSHTPGQRPFYRSVHRLQESDARRIEVQALWCDTQFMSTYKLELLAGRNFDAQVTLDAAEGMVINEALMKTYGFSSAEAAVGQRIGYNGREVRRIIGVVRDFHFMSLHHNVEPMVLLPDVSRYYAVSARILSHDIPAVMHRLKKEWAAIVPDVPVNYQFNDAQYAAQYEADQRFALLMHTFSILAIAISCLGLFGLATFVSVQRTKEMGIRKSLGASTAGIVLLLTTPFLRWILLANVFAWPLGRFMARQWLQHFAFQTNLSLWVFVLSGAIAMLIALTAVGYQVMKAATANPVQSLRYE